MLYLLCFVYFLAEANLPRWRYTSDQRIFEICFQDQNWKILNGQTREIYFTCFDFTTPPLPPFERDWMGSTQTNSPKFKWIPSSAVTLFFIYFCYSPQILKKKSKKRRILDFLTARHNALWSKMM